MAVRRILIAAVIMALLMSGCIAAVQETEHLLERVYQGSVSLMVSSLAKKQTLSQEEIDKLYAILREMEEEHD